MSKPEEPIEIEESGEEPDTSVNASEHTPKSKKSVAGHIDRFKTWYVEHKKWTVPASVLLLIVLLVAVPLTRYKVAGLFIKKDVAIYLVDSKFKDEIDTDSIALDGKQCGVRGRYVQRTICHNVSLGHHTITTKMSYYQAVNQKITVDIGRAKTKNVQVAMMSTGRPLGIRVINKISRQPVEGVQVKSGKFVTKSDKDGYANLIVDPNLTNANVEVSGNGYNPTEHTEAVFIPGRTIEVTPAGKVYFLSKLSGKIDVVKTNLDGTARQTVLPGTGNEQDQGTVLLVSRDWKYLALLSRRAGNSPSIYLLDTSNDSLSTIDEGSADFSLNGWVGDNFVYTVSRTNVQLWQPNRQTLKSFDASSKKLTVLDQTTASGSSSFDYLSQLIGGVYAYNDQVFYIMNWTASFNGSSASQLASKQATFNSIKPDGSAKKSIKSFGLASGTSSLDVSVDLKVENPGAIDLKFSDGAKDNFYVYANGQVKDEDDTTVDSFYNAGYPTYLQSPSGDLTFWSDERDGKNTLFIGDQNGQNGKQIATLSDYKTFGWYTDNYILVSKNSSELYIMPKGGSNTPLKISDYHKPALTYNGYGGGYGGL